MADTCTITRDPQGTDDDVLDPATLVLTPPGGDGATVYDGKCLVRIPRAPIAPDLAGRQDLGIVHIHARIPAAAPAPRRGDVFTLTAVGPEGDASLVGREMWVEAVTAASFLVTRQLVLVDYRRRPQ